MNRQAARSCQGKVRHATERGARIAMAITGRIHADMGLVFYRCPNCHGWHVGHATKGEQRRLRFNRLVKLIEKANET